MLEKTSMVKGPFTYVSSNQSNCAENQKLNMEQLQRINMEATLIVTTERKRNK